MTISTRLALALLSTCLVRIGWAAEYSPVGRWLTEDQRGLIEIYECGDALCGRIAWQAQPYEADGKLKVDRNNPSPAVRTQPLCGLQIMSGFRQTDPSSPNEWTGGLIYNPEDGNQYSAKLTMRDGSTLGLRGYLLIPLLGQTQTWTREVQRHPPCPVN